jgi:hypothetical protein
MARDLTKQRLYNQDVKWNNAEPSFVETVDMSGLKFITKDRKVGTIGDVVLGEVFIAMEGVIKVEFSQIGAAMYRALMPWQVVDEPVSITPPTLHKDLYDYAQALNLHPHDLPADNVTEDWVFVKTVPRLIGGKFDGVNWNNVSCEFRVFPDRTKAVDPTTPLLEYGYFGGLPEAP